MESPPRSGLKTRPLIARNGGESFFTPAARRTTSSAAWTRSFAK